MEQLYFLEIDASGGRQLPEAMFRSLPADKRMRLGRFRHEIDRKISAYAEILIRCLICMHAGAQYEEISIMTHKAGKPYLAGETRLEFNISHTRSAVAAAMADVPVGVDIERVREIDTGIAESVFTGSELALMNASREDRFVSFLDIWTKKEALMKSTGTGVTGDLKAFDVTNPAGKEIATMRCGPYILSVCSEKKFDCGATIRLGEADVHLMWRRYFC